MANRRKTVFLTGATGIMGWAGLQKLSQQLDHMSVTLLVRPSKVNKEKMAPYEKMKGLRIVWGDLLNYEDVLNGITGADYVLHVGGMVSPKADHVPMTTLKVNVTAAQNIVKAVKAQPDPDAVKVVYIGTVAELGFRPEPIHWGRAGDPLCPSVYDQYAVSKAIAERIFAESGLKYWVSLRQTGILYPELIMKGSDPITFHVPIRGVQEWATTDDSAQLLVNVCGDDVPDDFWNRFYNISSGAEFRLTFYDFECRLLKMLSCPPPEKIFESNWFALRNFHSHWYTDADVLDDYLHFRSHISCEDYFVSMRKSIPWFFSLAKIVPAFLIKNTMKQLANKEGLGTMNWIKNHNDQRVSAYFGSYEAWKNIPDWDHVDKSRPSDTPVYLDHGYDEKKPKSEWDIEDMRQAAAFRGGKCLSPTMRKGDWATPLEWECQFGHRFQASPTLILLGGHWCPECFPAPWNFDEIAKGNPFFAQVWYASHGKDEHNYYDNSIFAGMN